jgi:hypothetical protein
MQYAARLSVPRHCTGDLLGFHEKRGCGSRENPGLLLIIRLIASNGEGHRFRRFLTSSTKRAFSSLYLGAFPAGIILNQKIDVVLQP